MYLKSIEVQGFKSFANKINFQFHNGITGIVGPNGSGKSNVADAVRWVLGEQRIKQLRGASMQDVIFSGTEMRKPLGFAYVAITLDNSDHQLAIEFDEVTVARRLYRSGESEYLINGSPCRLKDVNELFYDTGIGKEGYSIIGQGQIDQILSGKPEDRRELFDEAAGIVKFKRRKVTAQKKLEDEQANLLRVTDILSEQERQIGPLEKQSEKAKIYLKKKEDLKVLDVNVFLLENESVRKELEETVEKHKIANDDLEDTTQKHEKIREEYDRMDTEIESLNASIEELRKSLTDNSVMKEKLEGQIDVLKEQINSAEGSRGHFETRMKALREDIRLKNVEKDSILADKKNIDDKLSELQNARDNAKNDLLEVQNKISELNNSIEEDKNTIIQMLNDRASIRTQMGRLDSMMEQIGIRKAELNSRLLRAKSDEEEQDSIIKQLTSQFEEVTAKITAVNDERKTIEDRIAQLKFDLIDHDSKLQKAQEMYHQEKSRLETISNLTERYEGYGNSIKRVMENKDKDKGIIGVVADIIKVDKKYETAIEIALGGNIQNIVTEDEETAKRMISFLKENKFGRATFLPLTSITNPQEFKNPEALDEKGVIGMADELVNIDKKYANVAKAMLGRIVVVDHVDNAVKIARKFDYGIRMVTLEGELLVPGGAISGGAFKNNSNLLGRRRELDELAKKVKELEEAINEHQSGIASVKEERNTLRTKLDELGISAQALFIEQNTARMNVIKAQERKDETNRGYSELKDEQGSIEERIREITDGKKDIEEKLAASENNEKLLNERILNVQNELDVIRETESDKAAKAASWDVEVQKILQKQEFEQLNVDRINGEIGRLEADLNEIDEALKKSDDDVVLKQKNIEEISLTIEAAGDAQNKTQIELKENTEKRDALSVKQKNFFSEREQLSERMSALDKEVYRLNARREKLEESIESRISYMWTEYEITLNDAASLRNIELNDLPSMKKDIAELKNQIRGLGDVNVNAIEDYKNLMERYTFLKTQHDDLVEAEKTLQGIIEELDTAMRKQFKEKFSDICREFDKVFRELFGGGKGELELMEDEDILEAGIKIIAQPPGKKLQNMMQMSGGEKALTAIALLFAIQNLKPSPFCLLDEIEAALDENNVGRFAKYLHKLTKHTQFIVITHRRGTMEKVDRLYGITMQEKGISALVSVDLIDKDLDN
ncbi:MAG: chromosome segregation protein SMC [Lachnospiraceae bacterium]|nr:chromosome segregation protein SMC [Candidatus Merdinaster equi]